MPSDPGLQKILTAPHGDGISKYARDEVHEVLVEGDVEKGRVAPELGPRSVRDVDVGKLLGTGVRVGRHDLLRRRGQHRHAAFGNAVGRDDVAVVLVGPYLVARQDWHVRLRISWVISLG